MQNVYQENGNEQFIGYIYKITNSVNNKVYIGQTRTTIEWRYFCHLSTARSEKSHNKNAKLYRAIRKYGESSFYVEPLEKIETTNLIDLQKQLDLLERKFILNYKSYLGEFGYNLTRGGQAKRSIANSESYDWENEYICPENRLTTCLNEIKINDNYAEIILYDKNGKETGICKIDIDDIKLVKGIKWHLCKCARGNYVKTNGPVSKIHNLLLNPDKNEIVIHLNKDGLDNRRSNLQIVSRSEKQQKSKLQINNKSGYKGVWFCKSRNKWQAQITIKNKTKSLGRFNTFEEAVLARKVGEEKYYVNN